MRLRFGWTLALAGMLGAWSVSAAAQELTLKDAVSRALAGHPALRAQGAAITAAERQADLDALAPPLAIGGELENIAGSGPLTGTSGAEATLRLSRVIELGGKRQARIALGQAEVSRQRHAAELARIEVAAETARRFVDVLADQSRLVVTREAVTRAEQTRTHVARWVEAGRSPDSDRHLAEIALGRTRLGQEDAEHELLTARMALASLWGEREPGFTAASGDFEALPAVDAFETLAARLPDSADQQSFGRDIASLEARRHAAVASARPDVSLSLGVRRLEAVDAQALVFGVSVPLGNAPRSALGSARVDAELAAVDARREAAAHEAYQRLFALHQELQHARHVFEAHRDQLIPKAEQALAVNRRGYELGRFSFLVLIQSQQQLAELRTAQIEAAARYHALFVDIERLTATSGAATP